MRFCGNFYFKLRSRGFTKLSSLQYLKFSGNFNVVCRFLMLFCAVFVRNSVQFCGIRTPLVVALCDTYLLILSRWLFEFLCCSEELLSLMCSIDSPAGDKAS